MTVPLSRRAFPAAVAGGVFVSAAAAADDKKDPPAEPPRDYPAPKFTPQFRKPLLGKTLVQSVQLCVGHGPRLSCRTMSVLGGPAY